jgi:hypothetical protein
MPASSSTSPPHRVAILMSPAGRFLQCRDCQLSFPFPAGAHYDATVKQFESHLCSSPIRSKDDTLRVASSKR